VSGSSTDGYTTAMYFIVTPAVLGPVCALLFVAAVYLCRRRRLDAGPSTVKGAPAVPQAAAEYRHRAAASRGRGALAAGIDEESEMMLPVGTASAGLLFSPPALPMPGISVFSVYGNCN